jgi:hypothetical protein
MKRLTILAAAVIAALAFGGGVSAQNPFLATPQGAPPKGLPLPSKSPAYGSPQSAASFAEPPAAPYDEAQSYATTTVTVLRSAPVVVTRSFAAASYGTSGGCRQQSFGAGVYGGGCNAPAVNPDFGAGAGYGYGAGVQVGPRFGAGRHSRGIPGAGGILGLPGRILRGPRTN